MTTDQPEATEATLRQRVQRAILTNALFDWRGGIILAVSILLGFFGPDLFPGSQWWWWLMGGAAAWGALTFSIMKDPETGAQVTANLLRQKYEPTTLRSPDSKERLIKAFEYRGRIAAALAKTKPGVLHDHLGRRPTRSTIGSVTCLRWPSASTRLKAIGRSRTI